ncbi:MAG: lytic transglycosylase domain-containing protein [Polyangiales bacterium]
MDESGGVGQADVVEVSRESCVELGQYYFQKRNWLKAQKQFELVGQQARDEMDVGRASYWYARSLERRRKKKEAIDAYRETIDRIGLHWYGLLAALRLQGLGADSRFAFSTEPLRNTGSSAIVDAKDLPPRAKFFLDLGLKDDANAEIESGRSTASPSTHQLIRWYTACGSPSMARRAALKANVSRDRPIKSDDGWWWRTVYPTPWNRAVMEAIKDRTPSSWLVYATMRQESGYNPNAISRVGAIGLLQLMPATAERVAQRIGVDFRKELLFDPSTNIRLGVDEMADLLDEFDGQFVLSIASYNAGTHRVRAWWETYRGDQIDEFVESIPFDETRNYVRRVISHLLVYRAMEAPNDPWSVGLDLKLQRPQKSKPR